LSSPKKTKSPTKRVKSPNTKRKKKFKKRATSKTPIDNQSLSSKITPRPKDSMPKTPKDKK